MKKKLKKKKHKPDMKVRNDARAINMVATERLV